MHSVRHCAMPQLTANCVLAIGFCSGGARCTSAVKEVISPSINYNLYTSIKSISAVLPCVKPVHQEVADKIILPAFIRYSKWQWCG